MQQICVSRNLDLASLGCCIKDLRGWGWCREEKESRTTTEYRFVAADSDSKNDWTSNCKFEKMQAVYRDKPAEIVHQLLHIKIVHYEWQVKPGYAARFVPECSRDALGLLTWCTQDTHGRWSQRQQSWCTIIVCTKTFTCCRPGLPLVALYLFHRSSFLTVLDMLPVQQIPRPSTSVSLCGCMY